MKNYEELLRSHHLKATHQRLAILGEIEKAGHIDVETLYKNIHDAFPSLALGTLYRNLNDLKETGILTEVKLPERKCRYEITKEPHVHMICEACGKVEDAIVEAETFVHQVEEETGYALKEADMVFTGTCGHCRENRKSA